VVAFAALAGGASPAQAQPGGPALAGQAQQRPLEVDVTSSPDDINGQPDIAVNPRNPNNLVFTATVFSGTGDVAAFAPCFVAYSMNDGTTWKKVTWPSSRPACGEAEVTVNAQGVFYLSSNELECPAGVTDPYPGYCDSTLNHTVVSRSTDGGATWSAPAETPLHVAARAHLQVDEKTGKLYALGGQDFLLPGAISVSSDQGRTWSTPVPSVPDAPACTPLPLPGAGCGPDPFLAVYDGILATTEEGTTQVLFNTSTDDGKTFTVHPVTDSQGTPVPSVDTSSAEFPYSEPLIAADPSQPGRFAILIPRGDPNTLQVYVTGNAGRTWQGPAVIPAPLGFMPAMSFSAQATLGVMWRAATDPAGGLNVYSAVSFDHGKSFSPAVKVNAVTEPINASGQPPGDHQSGIAIANGSVYVTWSDGRRSTPPGATDGIFARLPVTEFKHSS
jgi:hypothetical protein